MTPDRLAPLRPLVSADCPNSAHRQGLTTRAKISRKRSFAESESSSQANRLRRLRRKGLSARSDRSRKGWSSERRARQAALIRAWAPWRRSTGPKTAAGKTSCAMNALKHGRRSQAKIREYQRIRYFLRLVAQNIEQLRLHIRLRDARPRIKYKFTPASEVEHRLPLSPCGRGKPLNRVRRTMRVRGGLSSTIRKPRVRTPQVSAPTPWD